MVNNLKDEKKPKKLSSASEYRIRTKKEKSCIRETEEKKKCLHVLTTYMKTRHPSKTKNQKKTSLKNQKSKKTKLISICMSLQCDTNKKTNSVWNYFHGESYGNPKSVFNVK